MYCGTWVKAFQRNLLCPPLSETMAPVNQTTWCRVSEHCDNSMYVIDK